MLDSAGKSSSIGEMLTMSEAASPPPGERIMNIFDSFVSSVQFVGIVHDIPCFSHFTSLPPAIAAACSAVALPGSAVLLEPPPELDEPEFEFPLCSFSERLQRERAKAISTTSRMFFMAETSIPSTTGKSIVCNQRKVNTLILLVEHRIDNQGALGPSSWYSMALPFQPPVYNVARKCERFGECHYEKHRHPGGPFPVSYFSNCCCSRRVYKGRKR